MRILALVTAGFCAAVGLLIYTMDGICWLLAVASTVLTAAFMLLFRGRRRICMLLLGFSLGALWCSAYTDCVLSSARDFCGEERCYSATAVTYGEETAYGARVEAKLHLKGRDVRALLYFPELREPILPGDLLEGTGKFTFTHAAGDTDLYQPADGVFLTGRVGTKRVTKQKHISLQSTMTRVSRRVQEHLYAVFPAESAGYFTALVTGDRSGLSYRFLNDMSICGLYHSVSLSGMHISVLLTCIYWLLGKQRKLTLLFGVPVLFLFLMLSGMRPSTVRAVVMQTVMLAGTVVHREYDSLTSLSTAMLLLLLENPWSLAQWGLQLSFASTAGIVLLYPVMARRFSRVKLPNRVLRKAYFFVVETVAVSLSATLAAAPLMILYFGIGSLIAPVTNLLALWAVMFSFGFGIVVTGLSFLSIPAATLAGTALHLLYEYLQLVLRLFSRIPFAAVYDTQRYLLFWTVVWYGLLVSAMCSRIRPYLFAACAAASLSLCLCLGWAERAENGFTALNVGQGQSLVCTYGGNTYLIDCGGAADESGETAARYLLGNGISYLDGVILTHFDADHCNGILQLMDRVEVGTLYYPARGEDSAFRGDLLSDAHYGGVNCEAIDSVTQLPLSEGSLTVYPSLYGEKDNDTGLCILASAAECDILVTGDLSVEGENVLLGAYDFPDLEVLVAGHHGSSSSTGRALLDALKPEAVLVSVGENSYGHPSPKTLARIAEFGAAAYITKEHGNLIVRW